MIQRSHRLQDRSLCDVVLGGMGSAMANSGSARLAKVLRYASTGLAWATWGRRQRGGKGEQGVLLCAGGLASVGKRSRRDASAPALVRARARAQRRTL